MVLSHDDMEALLQQQDERLQALNRRVKTLERVCYQHLEVGALSSLEADERQLVLDIFANNVDEERAAT